MEKRRKLLGCYNYTVVLTYLGLCVGVIGIAFVMEEKYLQAVICLMAAGFCDMFDGTIASTRQRTEGEKCFGIQIDSLSDLICFGVLPGLFTYAISGYGYFGICVCCLYILCALIRLSYFNVLEGERQQRESQARSWYLGLPVTSIAIILPACFAVQKIWQPDRGTVFLWLLCAAAAAFVLPIPIKKPHLAGKIGLALVGAAELMVLFFGA